MVSFSGAKAEAFTLKPVLRQEVHTCLLRKGKRAKASTSRQLLTHCLLTKTVLACCRSADYRCFAAPSSIADRVQQGRQSKKELKQILWRSTC